jgi:hypothetical protein
MKELTVNTPTNISFGPNGMNAMDQDPAVMLSHGHPCLMGFLTKAMQDFCIHPLTFRNLANWILFFV